MARKTTVIETISDDIDGSTKNIETVTFALDGKSYEIDLGPRNAKSLRSDIEKWTESARKVKTTRARRGGTKPVSDAKAIREWALASGIAVPARGRIPGAVIEQYEAS